MYSEDYSPVSEPTFSILGKFLSEMAIFSYCYYNIVPGKKFQSNGKITQPKGGNC